MDVFAAQAPPLPIAVAYSGGADSSALLLACAARWPGQVVAWHVHHGLQPAAERFVRHCAERCAQIDVPLLVECIDARAVGGQSPEEAARAGRYAAFDRLACIGHAGTPIASAALAHHADDQAETVLLALSRGAGLPGLAAMPAHWRRGDLHYWRPLLEVEGRAIRAWLALRGERWVEDPTNAAPDYLRNRIRLELVPRLEQIFPGWRQTFARSARHAAQAQRLLEEIAGQDLAACGSPPRIAALQQLSDARQANLLRYWLRSAHGVIPSSAQLDELQRQITACRTRGHRLSIRVGAGQMRRSEDVLLWEETDRAALP